MAIQFDRKEAFDSAYVDLADFLVAKFGLTDQEVDAVLYPQGTIDPWTVLFNLCGRPDYYNYN